MDNEQYPDVTQVGVSSDKLSEGRISGLCVELLHLHSPGCLIGLDMIPMWDVHMTLWGFLLIFLVIPGFMDASSLIDVC